MGATRRHGVARSGPGRRAGRGRRTSPLRVLRSSRASAGSVARGPPDLAPLRGVSEARTSRRGPARARPCERGGRRIGRVAASRPDRPAGAVDDPRRASRRRAASRLRAPARLRSGPTEPERLRVRAGPPAPDRATVARGEAPSIALRGERGTSAAPSAVLRMRPRGPRAIARAGAFADISSPSALIPDPRPRPSAPRCAPSRSAPTPDTTPALAPAPAPALTKSVPRPHPARVARRRRGGTARRGGRLMRRRAGPAGGCGSDRPGPPPPRNSRTCGRRR